MLIERPVGFCPSLTISKASTHSMASRPAGRPRPRQPTPGRGPGWLLLVPSTGGCSRPGAGAGGRRLQVVARRVQAAGPGQGCGRAGPGRPRRWRVAALAAVWTSVRARPTRGQQQPAAAARNTAHCNNPPPGAAQPCLQPRHVAGDTWHTWLAVTRDTWPGCRAVGCRTRVCGWQVRVVECWPGPGPGSAVTWVRRMDW